MSDETKLLPCPFCGNLHIMLIGKKWRRPECQNCGAEGCSHTDDREAIIMWNRRAPAGESVEGIVCPDCWVNSPIVHAKVPKHWAGKRVRVTLEGEQ